MNKNEVKTALENEIKLLQGQCEILKNLQSVDVTKFDGKVITKRVQTHILSELEKQHPKFQWYVSLARQYSCYDLYVSKYEGTKYHTRKNIDIRLFNIKDNFDPQLFAEHLSKQVEYYNGLITKMQKEVRTITTMINRYNKICDDIEKFEKDASYKLRDLINNNRRFTYKVR